MFVCFVVFLVVLCVVFIFVLFDFCICLWADGGLGAIIFVVLS